MLKYLLSIDDGGTYIKAVLFDTKGNQIAMAKRRSEVISKPNGQVELDEEVLWDINCYCIRKVIEKAQIDPGDICCIGFSGQGKGLYMVDSEGKPFRNAITSSDSRADSYCRMWEEDKTAVRVFAKLLQHPVAGQTVPILRWMKENEPENYKKIRWIFSMKDYLFFRLTGKPIAGKGSQSGTLLVNLLTQDYDEELLQEFGIEEAAEKLPPLVWDTEICGYVSEAAAQQCGCRAGTPVSAGMFDVDASAVAMGIVDGENVFMITGTCGVNGYITDHAVTNGTVMFNSLYSLPGTYLVEEGSATSVGTLEWVKSVLFSESVDETVYAEINRMVKESRPEDSELIFLPLLYGFRHGGGQGTFKSRACWIGLCPEHSRSDMLRAVYEGVVFVHKIHLEHLLLNRPAPSVIRLAGGAGNSAVWVQMFADILQIPVEVVENSEMGAKGAAIASAAALGLYKNINEAIEHMTRRGKRVEPDRNAAPVYEEKFSRFKKVLNGMGEIWPLFS
ncbi:MAG: carbohydrate kinase [Clostridium sp.]|nr:carbohydrate kinase [Clostridium sp.]